MGGWVIIIILKKKHAQRQAMGRESGWVPNYYRVSSEWGRIDNSQWACLTTESLSSRHKTQPFSFLRSFGSPAPLYQVSDRASSLLATGRPRVWALLPCPACFWIWRLNGDWWAPRRLVTSRLCGSFWVRESTSTCVMNWALQRWAGPAKVGETMAFKENQTSRSLFLSARTDYWKYSHNPNTIVDCSNLPGEVASAATLESFQSLLI